VGSFALDIANKIKFTSTTMPIRINSSTVVIWRFRSFKNSAPIILPNPEERLSVVFNEVVLVTSSTFGQL
jgi:hypothetical protein